VLHEIGNHKRRKKFFIHRICRAQLYFAWFVEGNALLESCHAMETLLKTFNIYVLFRHTHTHTHTHTRARAHTYLYLYICIYIYKEYIEKTCNSCDNSVYFPSTASKVSWQLSRDQSTSRVLATVA